MQCPRCSAENPDQANFCLNCGARLTLACPKCGTELPPHARFCFSCGAQIATAETMGDRASAAVRALKRLAPAEFAERLLATRGQVVSERRIVTMLFSDVKGSTPMAEQLDPEEVLEVMDGAFDVLIEPITRYEGTLARLAGDGILAFFGAPIAHEDDAERGCRAALDIIERAQRYAARLEEERGIAGFDVRVGIHTGLVVVGEVGSDLRVEYTAMGDAVNLASRMEAAAEPGTILITGDTHRLIAPLFETQPLGPIEVRGKADPVSVYRVLAPRAVAGKPRGIAGLESPLVGRDAEFRALRETLKRLQAGVGGIVTLVGEAGIGKSRLVAELRKEADPLSIRWREGRCLSYGSSIAYLLWLDALRSVLQVSVEDPPIVVRDALQELVHTRCPDRFDDVYPYLAHLSFLPLDAEHETLLHNLEGEALKRNTFHAVRTLIECSAHQQPLVIVCEDLSWADPTSIELLEHLLPLTDTASLLIICVFRPHPEHGSWHIREAAARLYRHRHTDLWLDPLSGGESRTLVANLLGVEALPQALRGRILSHAEGNPFYVEEILRSLIDSEAITQDEATGRWRAAREVEGIAIPDTLQGVLMARIDRLQEETRRVLQLAAVIGRIFLYRVLEAIAEEERELDGHLLTLQREQIIRERSRMPELEYIFKHQLTREVAYSGLLRRERQLFHRRVAEALERLFADRIEERVDLLAYHWEQAEEREKAVGYLAQAGDRALGLHANEEAMDYYQKALDLAEGSDAYDAILARRAKTLLDLFQGREAAEDYEELLDNARRSSDQVQQIEALLGLARACYLAALDTQALNFASRSRELYEVAYILARDLGDRASMVRALTPTQWFVDFWPGYGGQAAANVEEALALSREIGDEELIIDSMMARMKFLGRAEAEEWGEGLVRQLESRRDLLRLKEVYFWLMWIHLERGNSQRCIECCNAGIQLAEEVGAPPVMYPTLKALALLNLGRYDAAWESLQREVADEAHPFGITFSDFGRGNYYLELMAYERAAGILRTIIERAEQLGRAWLTHWAQMQLVRSLLRAEHGDEGDIQRNTRNLEKLGMMSPSAGYVGTPVPASVLAELFISQGRLDSALQWAERACSQAEDIGARIHYLPPLELRLRILLQLDRPGDATSLADAAIQMAEEMECLPMLWHIRAAKAQALAMLGHDEASAQEYEAAAAIIRKLARNISDAELKEGFMASPLISSILARSDRGEEKQT